MPNSSKKRKMNDEEVYNDTELMTIKDDLNETSEPGNSSNILEQEVFPNGDQFWEEHCAQMKSQSNEETPPQSLSYNFLADKIDQLNDKLEKALDNQNWISKNQWKLMAVMTNRFQAWELAFANLDATLKEVKETVEHKCQGTQDTLPSLPLHGVRGLEDLNLWNEHARKKSEEIHQRLGHLHKTGKIIEQIIDRDSFKHFPDERITMGMLKMLPSLWYLMRKLCNIQDTEENLNEFKVSVRNAISSIRLSAYETDSQRVRRLGHMKKWKLKKKKSDSCLKKKVTSENVGTQGVNLQKVQVMLRNHPTPSGLDTIKVEGKDTNDALLSGHDIDGEDSVPSPVPITQHDSDSQEKESVPVSCLINESSSEYPNPGGDPLQDAGVKKVTHGLKSRPRPSMEEDEEKRTRCFYRHHEENRGSSSLPPLPVHGVRGQDDLYLWNQHAREKSEEILERLGNFHKSGKIIDQIVDAESFKHFPDDRITMAMFKSLPSLWHLMLRLCNVGPTQEQIIEFKVTVRNSIQTIRRVAYETQAQRKRRLESMRNCHARLKMKIPVRKKNKSLKKSESDADLENYPKIAEDHQVEFVDPNNIATSSDECTDHVNSMNGEGHDDEQHFMVVEPHGHQNGDEQDERHSTLPDPELRVENSFTVAEEEMIVEDDPASDFIVTYKYL